MTSHREGTKIGLKGILTNVFAMIKVSKLEGLYVAELCYTPDLTLRLESPETLDTFDVDENPMTAILSGSLRVETEDGEVLIEQTPGGRIHPVMNALASYSFIYESRIDQCVVDDGVLILTFEHGILKVLPFEHVESWQIYSEDGFRLVCMPGGEIANWHP